MTSSDRSPGGELPRVSVRTTSPHEADFRAGLWERLRSVWPHHDSSEGARNAVFTELQGLFLPSPPAKETPAEQTLYRLAVLRERILQAALFYAADLLLEFQSSGFEPSEDLQRGQWVQFTFLALHSAIRDCPRTLSESQCADLTAELTASTLRRLGHELPDLEALPGAVQELVPRLHEDYREASKFLLRMPVRSTEGPSGSELLAGAAASQVAGISADVEARIWLHTLRCVSGMLDGIDATACWREISASLAGQGKQG